MIYIINQTTDADSVEQIISEIPARFYYMYKYETDVNGDIELATLIPCYTSDILDVDLYITKDEFGIQYETVRRFISVSELHLFPTLDKALDYYEAVAYPDGYAKERQ